MVGLRHAEFEDRVKKQKVKKSKSLLDVFRDDLNFEDALDMEDDSEGCLVCHL